MLRLVRQTLLLPILILFGFFQTSYSNTYPIIPCKYPQDRIATNSLSAELFLEKGNPIGKMRRVGDRVYLADADGVIWRFLIRDAAKCKLELDWTWEGGGSFSPEFGTRDFTLQAKTDGDVLYYRMENQLVGRLDEEADQVWDAECLDNGADAGTGLSLIGLPKTALLWQEDRNFKLLRLQDIPKSGPSDCSQVKTFSFGLARSSFIAKGDRIFSVEFDSWTGPPTYYRIYQLQGDTLKLKHQSVLEMNPRSPYFLENPVRMQYHFGNIYVMDAQSMKVAVFSERGGLLRLFSLKKAFPEGTNVKLLDLVPIGRGIGFLLSVLVEGELELFRVSIH